MTTPTQPTPALTTWQAAGLVAGSMVGVGIFLTPHKVALAVGTGWPFLAVWLVGALTALCGALAMAELGAALPRSGGDYVYLRAAFGNLLAFQYGWLSLTASFSGAMATMADGITRYELGPLLGPWVTRPLLHVGGWTLGMDQLLSIGLLWLLTWFAAQRVHVGGRVQLWWTLGLFAVLLGGVVVGLADARVQPVPTLPAPTNAWRGALAAFPAVFFAYSGWNSAGYVAGEIRNPARALPRALVLATGGVGALYLLLCYAFAHVLPDLPHTPEAGSAFAALLFGSTGGRFMAVVVAAAVLGALFAAIVTGSRIYAAMAEDGLFFPSFAVRDRDKATPVRALVLQSAWTTLLLLSSTFDQLLSGASLALMLLSMATVAAVPVLRRRFPDAPRPFRTWGHPWSTGFYLLVSAAVLVESAVDSLPTLAIAAGLIGSGLVAFTRFHKSGSPSPP